MKTKLFTIILLTISTLAFSQNYKKDIESKFLEYNNYIVNQEFKKSTDFVPQEFYEIVPKEQMVLLLERTFNNPEIEFKLKGPQIIDISEKEQVEGKYYSLIKYSSPINMKFKGKDQKEETETERKLRMNLIKLSFEKTFGSDNVKYNEETGFFEINAQKQAYAISKEGETDWKFLVIESKQKFILEKLLPKQLVEKI
ncbi:hypothetical protein [Rufibacter roseolus]|uniref:hypothetical protein n=1 Tax=Rufibacter roseolus TaxID=2817375 RepID=UPI001B311E8B|nr:hypothetical protein [Rufibacter roseolus]